MLFLIGRWNNTDLNYVEYIEMRFEANNVLGRWFRRSTVYGTRLWWFYPHDTPLCLGQEFHQTYDHCDVIFKEGRSTTWCQALKYMGLFIKTAI